MGIEPKPLSEPYSEQRRFKRIPFFSRVDVYDQKEVFIGYALSIGQGGMSFSLPIRQISDLGHLLKLGEPITLGLRLPNHTETIKITAEIAWVGRPTATPQGVRGLSIGVSFDPRSADALAVVTRFIDQFRYCISVIDFDDSGFIDRVFGDEYDIRVVTSSEEAHLPGAYNALFIIGDAGGSAHALKQISHLVSSDSPNAHAAILYCASRLDNELVTLVTESRRIIYLPTPVPLVTLRTCGQRAIEAHMFALDNERLAAELTGAVAQLKRENADLREQKDAPHSEIAGTSTAVEKMRRAIERVAPTEASVMILGETGTGKELVARAVHQASQRARHQFVALNCAGLTDSLADSELFGHSRGAFTGAAESRIGIFEAANKGTLFLDEVVELSLATQAKLLRVLQQSELRRVGENRVVSIDVRVICATNRDISDWVVQGKFREDLYYRLASFIIPMPTLRERREDIPELVARFSSQLARASHRPAPVLEAEALEALAAYDWPGNIRQLKQTVERLSILSTPGEKIDASSVEEALQMNAVHASSAAKLPSADEPLGDALGAYERTAIVAALAAHQGVIAHAAEALGMTRSTLSRRCKQLGIATARNS
jgi:transcriptional regulator with GAF, ATPase, and Fis domain/Tfp pilus assembly protein PilZ